MKLSMFLTTNCHSRKRQKQWEMTDKRKKNKRQTQSLPFIRKKKSR